MATQFQYSVLTKSFELISVDYSHWIKCPCYFASLFKHTSSWRFQVSSPTTSSTVPAVTDKLSIQRSRFSALKYVLFNAELGMHYLTVTTDQERRGK